MPTRSKPRNVLVVEDDPFSRDGVVRHLTDAGYQVYEAASLNDAITAVDNRLFQLAVIDLAIPKVTGETNTTSAENGIALMQYIKQGWPDVGIVVWSAYIAIHKKALIRMFEAGYNGIACLPKGSSSDTFNDAIGYVCNGHVFLTATAVRATSPPSDEILLDMMSDGLRTAVREVESRFGHLSGQELKLVENIYCNNQQLASILDVRHRTVTNYLDKVYEKLGFRDPESSLEGFDRRALISLAALLHQLRQMK